MKRALHVLALLCAVVTLQAGTVDVTTAETVRMSGGDTLSFELFTTSYSATAKQFGLPLYARMLRFALATAPIDGEQEFSATLRTADASKSTDLEVTLDFTPGYLSSAGFQGAVSTLQGQFQLDSQLSQNQFGNGPVWLDFTNLGGDLTLGLSPLLLNHDLFASLSGGPLSVGAINGAVILQHSESRFSIKPLAANFPVDGLSLPEPGSSWMLAGGGALLLAASHVTARLSRTGK